MTFTLMLILNIVLDVLILGGLAFVMSRPARLTPHGVSASAQEATRERAPRERASAAASRSPALRPLLD